MGGGGKSEHSSSGDTTDQRNNATNGTNSTCKGCREVAGDFFDVSSEDELQRALANWQKGIPGPGDLQALQKAGIITQEEAISFDKMQAGGGWKLGPNGSMVRVEDQPGSAVKSAADQETENCVFCGQKTTKEPGPLQRNIDHAIPKSRGGNNTIDNAQTTCRTCNLNKGASTTQEYIDRLRDAR